MVIEGGSGARATAIAAAAIGLLIATAVIGYFNFGAVLAAMKPIGVGGFTAVVAAQLVLFVPLGLAWWLVSLAESGQAPAFIWARLLREAASDVLPFSHLGSMLIAARAAVLGGVTPATASGSSVVDVTVEIVAQLAYTVFGVAVLARRLGFPGGDTTLIAPILGALVIFTCVVVGFVATQRRGLHAVEKLVQRLLPSAVGRTAAIRAVVEHAYARPGRLCAALGLHLIGWFASAAGTWLILRFIGHPIDFLSVAAIESLLFAVRNAAFMVPSGLGVQEGAYVLIGPLFGLPADAALALSLLKRARDLAIGIPMLLGWQIMESRRSLVGGERR